MDHPLSNKLSDVLTLDVIELIGDEACLEIETMQNENAPENRIITYIERKLEEVTGKLETNCYEDILDKIRKTTRYQADFLMLKKSIMSDLPIRIARNHCFDLIGLPGCSLMDDHDVSVKLIKGKNIRLIAKALVVKDFMQEKYHVTLEIL